MFSNFTFFQPCHKKKARAENQCINQSLVERLCDFKIYAICWALLDLNVHLTRQPSRPRTMIFSAQQQVLTTLFRLPSLELAPYVVLVLIWWVFTPSVLRLVIELLHARPRLVKALRKSIWLVGTSALLFSLFLPPGTKNSCCLHGH